MKRILFSLCALLTIFLAGCREKAAPLKEGVLWSVRWIESSSANSVSATGLYRTSKVNPQLGGNYNMDMYGVLYPTCLEVRFVDSKDSHAQIIPMNQIIWLEFGDGGTSTIKY